MLRIPIRFACICALSVVFLRASAQGDCVDIDAARYPINIGNVETSPGHFGTVSFEWNTIWNFTDIKQTKRTVNIGSNGLFNGFLEYKPASYSLPQNATKDYPVIIYFHGGGSKGNGSAAQLCRLFKDLGNDLNTHLSIPGRVERNTGLFTQSFGGVTYEYLVISPQFNEYTRSVPPNPNTPDRFPSADDVEDVIDYVVQHYRIDERRIYLTGFSNGANMIVEYAGSSVARAKRVAAIMPVSLCSQLGFIGNTNKGIFAKNIGLAKLKTWFVFCEGDPCGASIPNAWVDSIRKVPGFYPPRYTRLRNINPPSLYNCSDTLLHDSWSRAYDPNFTVSYNFTTSNSLVDDGIDKNMYDWFTEQINAVLPVKLKTYTARLLDDHVQVDWVTSDEKDNASFTIERAGADQNFKAIGTLPGSKSSQGDKAYTFTDKSPLDGLSFYRLVQTDIDGEKDYFDIKKIINQKDLKSLIVSPNPFTSQISAFITLNHTQKVRVTLTDISGKELLAVSGVYNKGLNEIRLPAQNFAKGIYLLKVNGDDVSVSQKVIKR